MFKILQNKQNILFSLNLAVFALFLSLTLSFWLSVPLSAQESDAIAIRIYKNVNNYSAARWYDNEFVEDDLRRGSPQSISDVDGYEAVKDGRTVYVNAGNMDLDSGNYYANIYTLSFSQEPDTGTMKVHTNMLKHWTFNTNLIDPDDYGYCSIPSQVCLSDADCFSGYICHVDDGSADGDYPDDLPLNAPVGYNADYAEYKANYYDNKCHLPFEKESVITCWRDTNCKSDRTGLYCSGRKAEVTRRTKRLADLADIKTTIMDFVADGNDLPTMAAGSYLPGITISTWESWNDTLATELQVGELPDDPINTMGSCVGDYDPDTCWDDVEREFIGGNIVDNGIVERPFNSSFYGYSAEAESVYSFSLDGTIVCPLDGNDCYNLHE